ncbi:MFS transporter [Thermoleophilia bacterium SCSIO 60948]|nr:MFS transporter [Thermoleophilia bacterium SCSIO 60948]
MGGYRELMRGAAGPLLLTSGIARLGAGIEGLAFLVFFELETGSYATAGVALGVFILTGGLLAPVRGRLVDLSGAPALLGFTLAFAGLGATILAIGLGGGTSDLNWILLSALTGVVMPPFSGWTRAALAARLDGRDRELAFSLDGVLEEISFVTGPLIAGAFIALDSPEAAIAVAVALSFGGGLALVARPGLRSWRPALREARVPGAARAPLNGILLVAIASLAGVGAALGFAEVAITAFAEERDNTAAAGIVLAVLSVSGIIGALLLGSRERGIRVAARHALLFAWFAGGLALLPLAESEVALAGLIVIPGLALTPIFVTNALLVGELSAGHPSAAAFSGVTTSLNAGFGIGAAFAGAAVEGPGTDATFLLAAAAALAGLAFALPPALRSRPSAIAHPLGEAPLRGPGRS